MYKTRNISQNWIMQYLPIKYNIKKLPSMPHAVGTDVKIIEANEFKKHDFNLLNN